MTKLSTLVNNKPIPLSFAGVYVKNIPAKEAEAHFGDIQNEVTANPEAVITRMFQLLICDENGDMFEDMTDYDAITAVLPLAIIHGILNEVPSALMPTDANVKK